jgi:hypothetical protein
MGFAQGGSRHSKAPGANGGNTTRWGETTWCLSKPVFFASPFNRYKSHLPLSHYFNAILVCLTFMGLRFGDL